MKYTDAINYIHSLSKFAKKKGHHNINMILNHLDNPQDKLKFVHIAGTNGKGSAAAFVSSVLRASGLKVGTFISPFIERFNERIQIDFNPIEDDALCDITSRIKAICDTMPDVHPLEFEVITAIGFEYFVENNCDVVVLETGLGGRLDSTNVITTPLCEMIMQIGLDHTEVLGNTLEKIAAEKAGIIKPHTKVVVYPYMDDESLNVIKDKCKETSSSVIIPDMDMLKVKNTDIYGSDFSYKDILDIHISLVGEHQIVNALCAIETILNLPFDISYDNIRKGLSETRWPCRFEVFKKDRLFILDGAHNPPGITSFKNTVNTVLKDKNVIFVVGMLNDKDYKNALREIKDMPKHLIVTSVPSIRQTATDEVYEYVKSLRCDAIFIEDNKSAIQKAIELSSDEDAICIFGSLYLVGDVRGFVKGICE